MTPALDRVCTVALVKHTGCVLSPGQTALPATVCTSLLGSELEVSTPMIVTVCPAGQTKEEQPSAIRLHGGDVVIMSGPARMCYHGVPRVFGEDGTPGDGAHDADPGNGEYAAFAEHMRSTRINISIRASR